TPGQIKAIDGVEEIGCAISMALPEWMDCVGCLKSLVHWTGALGIASQALVLVAAAGVVLWRGAGPMAVKRLALLIGAGSLMALLFGVTSLYSSERLAGILQAQVHARSKEKLSPSAEKVSRVSEFQANRPLP
ncbi:MAG: hypothetical protein KIT22_05285, partial [Verrucomicrobiae bacterium]|nr:hypothetical protein [Verrucomicrobiae bacterium]